MPDYWGADLTAQQNLENFERTMRILLLAGADIDAEWSGDSFSWQVSVNADYKKTFEKIYVLSHALEKAIKEGRAAMVKRLLSVGQSIEAGGALITADDIKITTVMFPELLHWR
jgi:hypothetical protein